MLGQIGRLDDAGVLGQIARRSDDDPLDVAAHPHRDHRGVRQLADPQGHIDPLLDEVGVAVQQDQIHRNGRIGFKIGVDNRPQDFLAADRRSGDRQSAARSRAFIQDAQVRLLQIDQDASTGGRVAFSRFAEP
jgi:hypothetical protein